MRESGRAEQITATIIETARQCNLDKDVSLPADDEAAKALSMDERDMVIGNVYRWGPNLPHFVNPHDLAVVCKSGLGGVRYGSVEAL